MLTRAERKEFFEFYARERDCVVCADWPRAKKPKHRSELDRIPINGTCARCYLAFVRNITVYVDSKAELEALQDAVRQERRKGSLRSGHELLREIRAKPPKH